MAKNGSRMGCRKSLCFNGAPTGFEPVTLKPRDGVLWAHPAPNAKNLVDTRLSGRLSINSQKMVAGAGLLKNVHLYTEPFPLIPYPSPHVLCAVGK